MMFSRLVLVAATTSFGVCAFAEPDPLAEAFQQAQTLVAAPAGSPTVTQLTSQAGAVAGPLTAFWTTLPEPDAVTMRWLQTEVPALNGRMVRQIDLVTGRALLDSIIDGQTTLLDFLTRPEISSPIVFYVPPELLASAWSKYDHLFLTPGYGKDVKGRPFRMAGLLLGNGRVDQIYDRDFTYSFNRQDYSVTRHVAAVAEGPGAVSISGFSTYVWFFHPVITRMTKINMTTVHVETDKGARDVLTGPIARRATPLSLP